MGGRLGAASPAATPSAFHPRIAAAARCVGSTRRPWPRFPLVRQGEKLDDIMKSMSAVAEGVLTSRSAHDLAKKKGIDCAVIEVWVGGRRPRPSLDPCWAGAVPAGHAPALLLGMPSCLGLARGR